MGGIPAPPIGKGSAYNTPDIGIEIDQEELDKPWAFKETVPKNGVPLKNTAST